MQRRKLLARALGVEPARAATFDSWADCWQAIAALLADRRHILILDEFTYAAEADPAMLSSLQHAWDQQFKGSQTVLILCGSHVHTMETLQARQSPLFGRLTAQWWLRPFCARRVHGCRPPRGRHPQRTARRSERPRFCVR